MKPPMLSLKRVLLAYLIAGASLSSFVLSAAFSQVSSESTMLPFTQEQTMERQKGLPPGGCFDSRKLLDDAERAYLEDPTIYNEEQLKELDKASLLDRGKGFARPIWYRDPNRDYRQLIIALGILAAILIFGFAELRFFTNTLTDRPNDGSSEDVLFLEQEAPNPEQPHRQVRDLAIKNARRQISDDRLITFFRAAEADKHRRITAIRLICEELDRGHTLDKIFNESGYHLSVLEKSESHYQICFGYQAGPLAGDGGEWEVSFSKDEVVDVRSQGFWIS